MSSIVNRKKRRFRQLKKKKKTFCQNIEGKQEFYQRIYPPFKKRKFCKIKAKKYFFFSKNRDKNKDFIKDSGKINPQISLRDFEENI